MEINNQEFKKGFRGYNEAEVDEFIDRVVADYEKLMRDNEKLREQLRAISKELDHYKEMEHTIQETLKTAKQTSDELLETAKKHSKEMRDNAVRESQSIYKNTIDEAENIRTQAKLDAQRVINETNLKLRVTVAEYDRIIREKNSFLIKLRAMLESDLASTLNLLSTMPPLEEPTLMKLAEQEKNIIEENSKPEEEKKPAKTEKKSDTPKEKKPAEKPVEVEPQEKVGDKTIVLDK